jgi:hypothetical protein
MSEQEPRDIIEELQEVAGSVMYFPTPQERLAREDELSEPRETAARECIDHLYLNFDASKLNLGQEANNLISNLRRWKRNKVSILVNEQGEQSNSVAVRAVEALDISDIKCAATNIHNSVIWDSEPTSAEECKALSKRATKLSAIIDIANEAWFKTRNRPQ